MRRIAFLLTLSFLVLSPPGARAFIAGILACEFDPTSTACIARQIGLLQKAEKPGAVKNLASALLSYSWARRGQALYSRSMEGAPRDRRVRAYAATKARAALGDFKTARRAAPYIRVPTLQVRALWSFGMSAVRRGAKAEAEWALEELTKAIAKLKSPAAAVVANCRGAMVAARLGKTADAKRFLAHARRIVADRLPAGAVETPLLITCTAGTAARDRAAAEKSLSKIVARLRRDRAMPVPLKLTFLAQAAEQWTRLGADEKSQAVAREAIGAMAPLPAAQRLAVFRYLLFASFRKAKK